MTAKKLCFFFTRNQQIHCVSNKIQFDLINWPDANGLHNFRLHD